MSLESFHYACRLLTPKARRLKEFKDTTQLFIFTLDLITRKFPIITAVDGLPHDTISIYPCDPSLGGVIIVTANSLIYVDQASRKTLLPVNGWAQRVSDMQPQTLRDDELERNLCLEGSVVGFVDERTFFIVLHDGTVYPVDIIMEGRIVSRLAMGSALAHTTIPSVISVINVDSRRYLFVGSTVGPSVLLKSTKVQEEIPQDLETETVTAAVAETSMNIELDDDEGGPM